ncbi:MAG: glycoside hydrolase family 2 TIM barrel-domain containing protein [bacterium]|nr:glycoside hydrolase family 2 TIM barrel-domain containing protein [bacterium]
MKSIYLSALAFLLFAGCSSCGNEDSPGNIVKIEGSKGNWRLTVNGEDFDLKGVGVGRAEGEDGTDYLLMAKEMGANSVRTWGTDQGNPEYLRKACEYGLLVDAGVWFNRVYEDGSCSYITDGKYVAESREAALDYVRKNMNNHAILFWNLGNETIFFTKSEEERIGFCKFLEDLIKDVHKIDPNHPVIYTTSFTTAVDYIEKYVPSLDILGINVYGGLSAAHKKITEKLNIPYIVTEYGPYGPWNSAKDVNMKSVELSDKLKSNLYMGLAEQIKKYGGYCLGGYVFHLGDTTQESGTWWNLNYRSLKKMPYLRMQGFYTGRKVENQPPLVRNLVLGKYKNIRPGEKIRAETDCNVSGSGKIKFSYFASTAKEAILLHYVNEEVPIVIEGSGLVVDIIAPSESGIYRVYVLAEDDKGNASTYSKTISVSE